MLKTENLVKNYGSHRAVDNLSVEFKTGRVYGLLGANGAGKSTTMNMMTGYLAPSGGRVLIDDIDIFKKPEKAKKNIGYLPEQPPLYMDMTVREYLGFVSELKKIKKKEREKEIARVSRLAQLEDVENRLIRNLSKGYRQRVGLAQALTGDPGIIILDEPTVGLDPSQIISVRSLIREIGKDHTVIFSSHILSEVQAVCDEILIISRGKLVASGTPQTLEEGFGSGACISITVKGTDNKLKEFAAREFPGYDIRVTKSGEGLCSAEMDMGSGDIRERLFYALAKAQIPMMELAMKKASLEDVFLELTAGDDGAGEDTDAGSAHAPGAEDTVTDELAADKGTAADGIHEGAPEDEKSAEVSITKDGAGEAKD